MLSRFLLVSLCVGSGAIGSDLDYDSWDRVVKRHLRPGESNGTQLNVVDYCGVKRDSDFWQFLSSLATVDLDGLSKNELYAVYTNAYNAFAFSAVLTGARQAKLEGRCIKSMWPVPDGIPEVFDLQIHNFSGRLVSLNEVEAVTRDPSALGFGEDCRVHGSLVCGGVSCPNVRVEAFRPLTVEAQLSDNMREWLAEPRKGSALDPETGLTVSLIFKWFADDFAACSGSAAEFIATYAPKAVADYIASQGEAMSLSYFDYDKSLNGDADSLCDCAMEEDPVSSYTSMV